ncbi:MAG: F0F1 ATP synthase subunit C [Candidatus Mycalebacterium zealandia]|nr:MAG: F0F1 ATP synthase subunit C [Candidatus Mycalebacterium zealandia]
MKRFIFMVTGVLVAGIFSFAPEAAAASGETGGLAKLGIGLGAGLGIGIAAGIAGLGQGRATAAALEGIARNPGAAAKIQTPMIIGLALIESLVIYALLIAFLLQGKI